ncbi:hypothetical protein ACFSCX_01060 [Bacillus salitolerans]|uniref:GAF domain-containing protein n=1 Tax=Bacillus salitolerans TaxID=1437434 RepID=A0ABW4LJN3_9BACI
MFYQQGSTIRKLIELFVLFILIFIIDSIVEFELIDIQPSPFILVLLLFSIRYGWRIGVLTFIITIVYFGLRTLISGEDLFLLFFETERRLQFIIFFIISIIAGAFSTSQRERYEDLHFRNEELRSTLENIESTIKDLSFTNKVLEERVIESETSIASVYQMTKLLDQDNLEIITDEAINILMNYFHAETFGIYHLDRSLRSMRIKVRKGNIDELPQSILLADSKDFYERLLMEKKITIKKASDPKSAPVIAGPIMRNGEIRQVLIIKQIDFYRLSEHGIQLLYWLLQIISDSYAKAEAKSVMLNRVKMFEGTNIYYKDYLDEYIRIERKREENFKQPFALLEIKMSSSSSYFLKEINYEIFNELREVDKVGYDEDKNMLYILLPGTDPARIDNLKKRIFKRLEEWMVSYDG